MKSALKVVADIEIEPNSVGLGTHVARLRRWTEAGPTLMLAGCERLVSRWSLTVTQAELQAACAAQMEASSASPSCVTQAIGSMLSSARSPPTK